MPADTTKSSKAIMSGMRQLEIRTRRMVNDSLAGEYHSVFKGRGMDFDEVREYVAGDRYTISDIMALVTVNFAARIDLKVPEGCVHLRRWHQAVNARPSADA